MGGGLFGGFANALTAGTNNTQISDSRKAMGKKITEAFDNLSKGMEPQESTYKPTQPQSFAQWQPGNLPQSGLPPVQGLDINWPSAARLPNFQEPPQDYPGTLFWG
jgi:hypothetical protein